MAKISKDITRLENNGLIFNNLNKLTVATHFIEKLDELQHRNQVLLDFGKVKSIFPNAGVPFAGIMDYFRRNYNTQFQSVEQHLNTTKATLFKPLHVKEQLPFDHSPLNKVWQFFDSEDVNVLVDGFVNELREIEQFETGVLDGLTWSLNEVMDNVLQHSLIGHGFVMGQIHRRTKHIAFCVFDNGQGIYNSLKNSPHAPASPQIALQIAVKESITRDKSVGQGNGMYGLHQIVKQNQGSLTIISNSALYQLNSKGNIIELSNISTLSEDNGGTLVDFQLDYKKKVSISDALIIKGQPYTGYVNYYLESLENELGDLVYILRDWSLGVGTRPSGKALRTKILNNYRDTRRRIVLDFSNINVISSSFADELVGKLLLELGFFGFNNIVKLKNMNELIQQLVQRSVAQRMAESLNN
ncbi:MAG: hypothetical protein RLZZ628_25 [Bacteroidota bacterium]|jgi:hypothetical protein